MIYSQETQGTLEAIAKAADITVEDLLRIFTSENATSDPKLTETLNYWKNNPSQYGHFIDLFNSRNPATPIGSASQARKKRYALIAVLLVVVAVAGYFGWKAYKNR